MRHEPLTLPYSPLRVTAATLSLSPWERGCPGVDPGVDPVVVPVEDPVVDPVEDPERSRRELAEGLKIEILVLSTSTTRIYPESNRRSINSVEGLAIRNTIGVRMRK